MPKVIYEMKPVETFICLASNSSCTWKARVRCWNDLRTRSVSMWARPGLKT